MGVKTLLSDGVHVGAGLRLAVREHFHFFPIFKDFTLIRLSIPNNP
jgi:hypothetical protein